MRLARSTALPAQTLHDNVDAKWGENSPSFSERRRSGAQECAIHELFHKEDYKLFFSSFFLSLSLSLSLFLSFAPFGQSNPSIDQYLFGLSVRTTRVTQKILSERPLLSSLAYECIVATVGLSLSHSPSLKYHRGVYGIYCNKSVTP